MILEWIGDAILLLVVAPVVVVLLRRVLETATGIAGSVERIAGAARRGAADLDAVPLLLDTQRHVHATIAVVADYGGSLDVILDDAEGA